MATWPKCYVASPYRFAEATKYWYDTVLVSTLAPYVEVLDPWKLVAVSHILASDPNEHPELWADLGDLEYKTIREEAEMVIAILDQEPLDYGTVCKVVWAAAHDVPVIGYRGDLRRNDEPAIPFNLMIAAAIRKNGGMTVRTLEELELVLPGFTAKL